jgi:hypothetical protein
MTRAKQTGPRVNALASAAQIISQRQTCEGCVGLRTHPRPMCQLEASPNFRMVRDTYHTRCQAFTVSMQTVAPPVKEAPPMSRAQVAGEVPRLKRKRTYTTGDVARRLV